MQAKLVTTKVTPLTLDLARLIAERTGEKQYRAIERALAVQARKLGIGMAKPLPAVAPAKGA